MTEITSRKNKTVLDALALHDKKARDSQGLFFTEGVKLFREALDNGVKPERVFVTDKCLDLPELGRIDCEIIKVTDEVYGRITDESAPEGVFAIFRKTEARGGKAPVLLLEGIQDPGNVGTLIRCAAAFGVGEVITVGCADIYNPKTVRSTMGAVFKVACRQFADVDSAVEYARAIVDTVVAAALQPDSVSIEDVDTSRAAIMIGSEGRGLSERAIELADKKMIIPMENMESLNASVAGAICMYDAMMKRNKL